MTVTPAGPPPREPMSRRAAVGFTVLAGALLLTAVMAGSSWARSSSGGLPLAWCRWQVGDVRLPPLVGARFFTSWQVDGVALAFLAPFAAGYAYAVSRVRARHPTRPWPAARSLSFAAGLLVVVLATCSSVGVYDMTLFSVHMVQHLLLIMVAPPLLVAGRPLTLALHATRNPWHTRIKHAARSRVVSAVTAPPVAYGLYAVTIVGTHLTHLMDTVMQHAWLGQAEHLLYLVAGCLFFVLVFGDEPIRWRLAVPGRLLLLVLSMAIDTFVGVVLLQGTTPIVMTPHPGWGSSALLDTRTGGGIMWVVGDLIMAVTMVLVFRAWVRRPEHARRQSHSWLEQSRNAELVARTGYRKEGVGVDLDDDEAALASYNAWLAGLAAQERRPS